MNTRSKILKILNDLGMSGQKASEAMGIAYSTFNKNKNEKELRHHFNEKNYHDLVNFIKQKASEI